LKAAPGVTPVQGNLLEPATVRRVFDGVESVFLLNPSARPRRARRCSPSPACAPRRSSASSTCPSITPKQAGWLPHFGSKVGVEAALKVSGLPFTILRPNNFYQNDYWFKDVLLQYGLYPQPIGGVGISRVDVRDIAEAAAIALTSSGHEGQSYDLGRSGGGDRRVDREVVERGARQADCLRGDDLDAWEKVQLQYLPDWMVFDFPPHVRALPGEGTDRQRRGDRAADQAARPRAARVRRLHEGDRGRPGV
jgi:uncharacterized protein YbjT (DUF2867 family)